MFNIRNFLGLNYYISELDQFLKHYNSTHTKLSASQRQEMKKYKEIFKWRDDPNAPPAKKDFWSKLKG